jgi:dsRNA-specific ribonuclease
MTISAKLDNIAAACKRRGERECSRHGRDERSIAEATFLAMLAACIRDQAAAADALERSVLTPEAKEAAQ